MTAKIPVMVLGGTGYVAGELLRLIAGHPHLIVAGVMSESRAGDRVGAVFPQLQNSFGELRFETREVLLDRLDEGPLALFSAAPHGASAALVSQFIEAAGKKNCELTVVDASADFRYRDAATYEKVYGQQHGAPDLLDRFASVLPEHRPTTSEPHIGHPGCFATALLMAAVPLVKLDIVVPDLFATGITGSTGSGRTPTAGTHHPERHANLFAYKPLAHRHSPEVVDICETVTGRRPDLHFVPHSGPFARGIHLTMQANLKKTLTADAIRDALADFYSGAEFVRVQDGMPRIKDVAGSNYCHMGVATDGGSVTACVVIDNLVKGAAGGAMQWMNRKLGFAENAGLAAPAIAWI